MFFVCYSQKNMDKSENMDKTKDFDSSSDTIIVTPEKSPVKNNDAYDSMRTYGTLSLLASRSSTITAEGKEQMMQNKKENK